MREGYCDGGGVVVVAQSTSAKQTLSGWYVTIVCELGYPSTSDEAIATEWPAHGSVRDRIHNILPGEPVR